MYVKMLREKKNIWEKNSLAIHLKWTEVKGMPAGNLEIGIWMWNKEEAKVYTITNWISLRRKQDLIESLADFCKEDAFSC